MKGGLKANTIRGFIGQCLCIDSNSKRPKGFTVIEVLIVLAVTGLLFVSAAILIAGRQGRTQFDQAIRDVQSQIQQVINEVTIGYYPNNGLFSCTAGASGPVFTSSAAGQGTNEGCVFLGKVIQFDVAGTSPEEFKVYTITGLQKNSSGQEITAYNQAFPTVVAPSASNPTTPDATETKKLLYGLSTHEAYYGAVKTNIGSIAFAPSLVTYGTGTSGAQQVNVIPINGSILEDTSLQGVQKINTGFASSPVNPTDGPKICFVSGSSDQSGLITIGTSGRQLSVTLLIKSNKTCS